jgi:hypothetical protein
MSISTYFLVEKITSSRTSIGDKMLKVIAAPLVLLALITGCTRVYNQQPTAPSTTVDTGTKKVIHDNIEFRVIGNATGARVRYSNTLDGLLQITTTLPFQISIDSIKDTIFLSLEATPTGFSGATLSPFMEVQIFVNGNLFREASSSSIF